MYTRRKYIDLKKISIHSHTNENTLGTRQKPKATTKETEEHLNLLITQNENFCTRFRRVFTNKAESKDKLVTIKMDNQSLKQSCNYTFGNREMHAHNEKPEKDTSEEMLGRKSTKVREGIVGNITSTWICWTPGRQGVTEKCHIGNQN